MAKCPVYDSSVRVLSIRQHVQDLWQKLVNIDWSFVAGENATKVPKFSTLLHLFLVIIATRHFVPTFQFETNMYLRWIQVSLHTRKLRYDQASVTIKSETSEAAWKSVRDRDAGTHQPFAFNPSPFFIGQNKDQFNPLARFSVLRDSFVAGNLSIVLFWWI